MERLVMAHAQKTEPEKSSFSRKLLPCEKETIIRFDMESTYAYVFTYQRAWITKLTSLGVKPLWENGFGGVEFEIPKAWIRIPLRPSRRKKVE